MPGADCGSEHVPVIGKMKLRLKRLKKAKTSPKLQLNMLENDELRERYNISVRNRFNELEKLTTVEKKWGLMKESITESAKEHIPTTKRKEDKSG